MKTLKHEAMRSIAIIGIIAIIALAFTACGKTDDPNGDPDHIYDELITFAKKLAGEIEYNYSSLDDYDGAPPQHTPGKRLHKCGGYSQEVLEKAITLESVETVQYWYGRLESGKDHAWNILKLVDGRTLYFDLTAFTNQRVNRETGEIYYEDYRWNSITFDENVFLRSRNRAFFPYGTLLRESKGIGYMSGAGTNDNPYIITKAEQLAAIALWVRSTVDPQWRAGYNAAHYKLGNNIGLSEYSNWTPIGSSSNRFMGVFDGNGKVISGLSINTTNSYQGLFGAIENGKVRNLGLENIIVSGDGNVGGIAGSIYGTAVISNCYTAGTLTGTNRIGGITGYIETDAKVSNCYSTAAVNGGNRVGGIAGVPYGTIENCAALNQSVAGSGNLIGRVYGSNVGTHRNNIAFADMPLIDDTTTSQNKTLTGRGGLDITAAQIIADGTLGSRFASPIWTTANGKLPGFGAARDMPNYIK